MPQFYEFDLCNKEKVFEFFEENHLVGVIHFAAAKAVGDSVDEPLFYYRNNLVPMINLLEAMNKHRIKNFVFSSSCCVYG